MTKVRLSKSPASPGIERVENFEMQLHVPYTETGAVVKIAPKIGVQDYQENADQPGMQVRQQMTTVDTPDTQTLEFNVSDKKTQTVSIKDKAFDITLDNVQEEDVSGFNAKVYTFIVEEK